MKRTISEFVRQKRRAQGSLTAVEREKVDELLQLWARRGARTTPIVPAKLVRAIRGIYAAVGLKRPHIAVVPSPMALAFAYGAVTAACEERNRTLKSQPGRKTVDPVLTALQRMATVIARGEGTKKVTAVETNENGTEPFDFAKALRQADAETHVAVGSEPRKGYSGHVSYAHSPLYGEIENLMRPASPSTFSVQDAMWRVASRRISVRRARALRYAIEPGWDAGQAVPRQPVHRPGIGEIELLAAQACHAVAGQQGLIAARRLRGSWRWGLEVEHRETVDLVTFRDVLGLKLPAHKELAHWELALIEGGMHVMHEEFCIVCDFPEVMKLDERNRPHCADGPSHRWRDGWALYHWHGIRIPPSFIEDKASLTAANAIVIRNVEHRRAAMEIVGWHNVLRELNGRVVAEDPDPQHGRLVDVRLPGYSSRQLTRFLHVQCATRREFAVGVPRRYRTVKGAHAWLTGLPTRKFKFPAVRT